MAGGLSKLRDGLWDGEATVRASPYRNRFSETMSNQTTCRMSTSQRQFASPNQGPIETFWFHSSSKGGLQMDSPASRRSLGGALEARGYGLCLLFLFVFMSWVGTGRARGDVALLVEEPYGFFGSVIPMGHTAIYLNHVCAETPTLLRRCQPGESGVVISRYSGIQKLDWVAIPLLPYLYAVEHAVDVPERIDAASLKKMRQHYAEDHLQSLGSPVAEYDRKNVWSQLLGAAYIRKIYSFEIATTNEQDDRLIDEYNGRANRGHFNLITNNCADFSLRILNFYYPTAVKRSIIADAAITTPKQIAKSLTAYARRHDQLELNEIIIPQIPGSICRSHTPRGVVESLLKTKKYALPIVALQPYLLAGIAATYLTMGRFDLAHHAAIIPVLDQEQVLENGQTDMTTKTLQAEIRNAYPVAN